MLALVILIIIILETQCVYYSIVQKLQILLLQPLNQIYDHKPNSVTKKEGRLLINPSWFSLGLISYYVLPDWVLGPEVANLFYWNLLCFWQEEVNEAAHNDN